MARKSKNINLEEQISKAQNEVVKKKDEYDKAVDELRQLLDKKKAIENKILIDAYTKSNATLEEVLKFLESKGKTHNSTNEGDEDKD